MVSLLFNMEFLMIQLIIVNKIIFEDRCINVCDVIILDLINIKKKGEATR